jgi:hypothetical protein
VADVTAQGKELKGAFAICTAQSQKAGYSKPGSAKMTGKGAAREKAFKNADDMQAKSAEYERAVQAGRQEEISMRALIRQLEEAATRFDDEDLDAIIESMTDEEADQIDEVLDEAYQRDPRELEPGHQKRQFPSPRDLAKHTAKQEYKAKTQAVAKVRNSEQDDMMQHLNKYSTKNLIKMVRHKGDGEMGTASKQAAMTLIRARIMKSRKTGMLKLRKR